ncbi:hypothetical protein B0813_001399 [Candidatus Fervidibacteria bacterium JGI MDM2 SSWTFF-3-K9]
MGMKGAFVCHYIALAILLQVSFPNAQVSQPGIRPLVPPDAAIKLKEAYAALKQGKPEKARDLAEEVFQKYGDVLVAWFPSWLVRRVKGKLPDPYLPARDLGKVKLWNSQVPLASLRHATTTVRILFEANWELVRFDEIVRWGKMLMEAGERSKDVLRRIEYAEVQLRQGWVYRIIPKPVRTNWRPLPLRFRLEDHFVVVPLDEAAKVLGFSVKVSANPKYAGGKLISVSRTEEPSGAWFLLLAHPFAYRLEEGRQKAEAIAYAPFEEHGKIWVPFYWLAKKAGLKDWELKDKRIYTSPR